MLNKLSPAIFALTLFLSASLIFSVQPMLGKMMLPHVGGSPAGWVVAMFFFQVCLLFGYTLAYTFSKLTPLWNAIAILLLLMAGTIFLPLDYISSNPDSISPSTVFISLCISSALPFMALSTLTPGLQRLFTFGDHKTANDPYYLYAASNIGSFAGLLAYPLILEPYKNLQEQSNLWMVSYAILCIAILLCTSIIIKGNKKLLSFKIFEKTVKQKNKSDNTTWKQRLHWLLLAAIPSSLMLGVTSEITTDIASVPMIWVIPLCLYLLTNIYAFSKRKNIDTANLSTLHSIAIVVFIIIELFCSSYLKDLFAVPLAILYLAIFTITALLLHFELAKKRPHASKITEFYFFLALGGAIGGGFNAFVAPTIFNNVYEFPLILIFSLLLNPCLQQKMPSNLCKPVWGIPLLVTAFVGMSLIVTIPKAIIFGVLILLIFLSSIHVKSQFATAMIAIVFITYYAASPIHIHRNFFGTSKVTQGILHADTVEKSLKFTHGTTLHGFQPLDEKYALEPLGYYTADGPVGDVVNIIKPKLNAVLGLGAGQLACYNKNGIKTVMYEIDPHVEKIARQYFTYLEECGNNEVIIGDARLELAKDQNAYDIIFMDAFSSDSIPVHLVTVEAFELYFEKLKEGGVILTNISNRHLDLRGPLSAIAKHGNYYLVTKLFEREQEAPYDLSSEWVVITKNTAVIKKLKSKEWSEFQTETKPWTDNYSNPLATMKLFNIDSSNEKEE